ncbi:DUF2779 domain-containing protein [Helicobacter ailurogastricus]|uniref:DUF2779 domain-containing protein n=1 Tax=Helicobacter ailurogastricus TaxID=1578720 RepID=A0A0K2Y5L3_9HELI|nr:DUF2779 domain-containing protein [Helicobacter ailurogastricus]BDQ28606.1 hypothetical protein ASB7_04430 [Helicobacter ailurogastricus]CRF53134.1 hypothetical protein HAL07_15990 [Helicobacter ailurogastricus]
MLSKSKFIQGMQCSKMLWLAEHKPEILEQANDAYGELDDKMQEGKEVGQLARELFAGGVEVAYNTDTKQMVARTQELLEQGVETIYEATFEFQGIVVMVDILEIRSDGVVLNEVKSSTSAFDGKNNKDKDKIKHKEEYLWDLGIQYYVLAGLGYNIKGAFLICLNNTYIRKGQLDLEQLFLKNDFLEFIKDFQSEISQRLEDIHNTLKNPQEPDTDIGAHCNQPYECLAKHHCWEKQRGIVGHEHIFAIYRHGFSSKIMKLYQNKKIFFKDLEEKDILTLTDNQRIQVECAKTNTIHIKEGKIKEFLSTLKYPVYHLDFETYKPAIPPFDGTKPHGQVPFQYSIHIDHGDGKLEHGEFLAACGTDGRLELAQRLVADIPSGACVLAYHADFEERVLTELAQLFQTAHQDLSKALLAIRDHIIDLETPFAKKYHYTPGMHGSSSIKNVLPALVPEFEKAYKDLELVHKGTEAMAIYAKMPSMPKEQQDKYKKALLEYCKLDTLAMVKVLEVLRGM